MTIQTKCRDMKLIAEYQFDFKTLDKWLNGGLSRMIIHRLVEGLEWYMPNMSGIRISILHAYYWDIVAKDIHHYYQVQDFGEMSREQMKFFAKYGNVRDIAIINGGELGILKSATIVGSQSLDFSNSEKEVIKAAKSAGINIVAITVNFGPSWNFIVKLTKLGDADIIAENQIDFMKLGKRDKWFKGQLSENLVYALIQGNYTCNMDIIRDFRLPLNLRGCIPEYIRNFYWVQDAINNGTLKKQPWNLSILRKLNNLPESEEFFERLHDILDVYMFSWDNVPGNDTERLLRFLKDYFDFNVVDDAEISKSDNGENIYIFNDENGIAQIMLFNYPYEKKRAYLHIRGGRHEEHELKVKEDNGKLIILYFDFNRIFARTERDINGTNKDEILEVFSLYEGYIAESLYNLLKGHDFLGKMSKEQMKFFAEYFDTHHRHIPFDYVAVMRNDTICIIEVKSTTIGRQTPHFTDIEKKAQKDAKTVGITVILATVSYESSWNLKVKWTKL